VATSSKCVALFRPESFLSICLQTRQIAVPSESALAVHTRSAQLQDKEEQQHLKKLVLDYEQREEAEEWKGALLLCCGYSIDLVWTALETRNRMGGVKFRFVG